VNLTPGLYPVPYWPHDAVSPSTETSLPETTWEKWPKLQEVNKLNQKNIRKKYHRLNTLRWEKKLHFKRGQKFSDFLYLFFLFFSFWLLKKNCTNESSWCRKEHSKWHQISYIFTRRRDSYGLVLYTFSQPYLIPWRNMIVFVNVSHFHPGIIMEENRCKHNARWPHLSRLKPSAFFALQKNVKKGNNLYLELVTTSNGWWRPICRQGWELTLRVESPKW